MTVIAVVFDAKQVLLHVAYLGGIPLLSLYGFMSGGVFPV